MFCCIITKKLPRKKKEFYTSDSLISWKNLLLFYFLNLICTHKQGRVNLKMPACLWNRVVNNVNVWIEEVITGSVLEKQSFSQSQLEIFFQIRRQPVLCSDCPSFPPWPFPPPELFCLLQTPPEFLFRTICDAAREWNSQSESGTKNIMNSTIEYHSDIWSNLNVNGLKLIKLGRHRTHAKLDSVSFPGDKFALNIGNVHKHRVDSLKWGNYK